MGPMNPSMEALGGHINGKAELLESRGAPTFPSTTTTARTHYRTSSLEEWQENESVEADSQTAKSQGRGKRDTVEVQELAGQVAQMSRTQAGSKYLQRQLVKGTGAAVDVILEEVENEIAHMMCDSYGNYLCSAAFQACSQRQRKRMLEKLGPEVVAIACDKRGTHALQALILLLQLKEEQLQLMNSIKDNVIELSMDPNGTHVVQTLLKCFYPSVTDWIFCAITDRMVEVAHHPYGLCVLKKCISQAKECPEKQEVLLKQLARHALDLVQGPYGNYAIQHALEEWGGQRCQPVLQKLE
ncbi:unnamed protein product, partial [Effrenium voratum]